VDAAALEFDVEVAGQVEMRSQQALLSLVAMGGGIALAPRVSVRGREDVAAVPLDPPLRRQLGWVRRRGRHLSPVARALLEELAANTG
jgi:DNA-binding transcriptional LysR family regulator